MMDSKTERVLLNDMMCGANLICSKWGERVGLVVEPGTWEQEVGGSRPTSPSVVSLSKTGFTPRKCWLNTQEAVAPSQSDWKIVKGDIKHQKRTKPIYILQTDIIHIR